MKAAKKAAGLCLERHCGNKSLAPVSRYCQKHVKPHEVLVRGGKKKGGR
jgi:hypothetical protein